MKTLTTSRQIGAYVRKKLKGLVGHSYSEKGKTHQRMAWMLSYGVCLDESKIKQAKLAKVLTKIQSKLDKSGIDANVYLTHPCHWHSCAKINIKMPLEQHRKIRSVKTASA